MTDAEVARLLKVSGQRVDGFRDHLILSFALGTALREHEIVGLDVEDVAMEVVAPRGLKGTLRVRRTLQLRVFKGSGAGAAAEAQRVPLSDGTYYKLEKYLKAEGRRSGPLFLSRKHGARLSCRAVRGLFTKWQRAAGFDHLYNFHALRHTSITHIYRATGDVRVAQRFARHASLNTTTIYAHVSDEEVLRAAKGLAS